MSPYTTGLVSLAALFLFLFSGMPIGFGMILVGFLGLWYLESFSFGISVAGLVTYDMATMYNLIVLPLFIAMGQFVYYSGVSQKLYFSASKWFGHLPGGLAITTIAGCAGFAALTGSSVAGTATMGMVALPEMQKYKYNPGLGTGCIAAGGTLGILIPPSSAFVLYGILTEESIGRLFIAGLLPGVMLAILFMFTIYIICRINPGLGPRGPTSKLKEKILALKGTWGLLLLFILVIGGLYGGIFTPTEAGAVGAVGALIIGLAGRSISWRNIFAGLVYTGQTTAMIFVIIIGAFVFSRFLAITKLPFLLSEIIAGMEINRYLILGIILFLYLILGCIMDAFSMIVLTLPILFPVILSLGFDPIWYGVLMVITIEMGLITPPVGMNVFVMQGVAKNVPLYTIFRGAIPFLVAMVVCLVILVAFPQIALFLPGTMK